MATMRYFVSDVEEAIAADEAETQISGRAAR